MLSTFDTMKHEDNIKKRIEYHKRMIESLSKHYGKTINKNNKKNVEKMYDILQEYEFVLQKKKPNKNK